MLSNACSTLGDEVVLGRDGDRSRRPRQLPLLSHGLGVPHLLSAGGTPAPLVALGIIVPRKAL